MLRNSNFFFRNNKKLLKKYEVGPCKYRKNKSEKKNTTNARKKSQTVRCHECLGFGHISAKCPSYKKTLGKATTPKMVICKT